MAVTQTAAEFTMVDKLAEIKKLVGDPAATENPMAFYLRPVLPSSAPTS